MFIGFKINGLGFDSDETQNYFYDIGRGMYEDMRKQTKETLSFLEEDGSVLDASKIQVDWFPKIKADIFISHSHRDEKLAVAFAGWLYSKFELSSFIDSCVWGYCDDLLKKIDNKYCRNAMKNTYNYNCRNGSTSIVHILLMNALTKMIDKTECLFFMDTDNSIPLKDGIERQTYSPWIFGEIEATRIIRRIKPDRLDLEKISDTKYFSIINESVKAAFSLKMDHLIDVSPEDLKKWCSNCNPSSRPKGRNMNEYLNDCLSKKSGEDALDQLYLQKQIITSKYL